MPRPLYSTKILLCFFEIPYIYKSFLTALHYLAVTLLPNKLFPYLPARI